MLVDISQRRFIIVNHLQIFCFASKSSTPFPQASLICSKPLDDMILSSTKRDKLFEIDARWPVKITFRVILNMICILSIICAMFTLTHNSNFNPKPFTQARTVLVYIPCVNHSSLDSFTIESSLLIGRHYDCLEYHKYRLPPWPK